MSDDISIDSSIAIAHQIIFAIEAGELENIREILSQEDESGRGVVTDDDIHEALGWAAREGSVAACRLLWGKLSRRGKRVYFATTTSRFEVPLHKAVWNGHLEVIRLFIKEFKMNINQKDYWGETPLCNARHLPETARFLLENGANVNQGGKHGPLLFAVHANNTEVSRLLLMKYRANPNLNRRPTDEEDAIIQQQCPRNTDNAIFHGNAEILRMLLECGAFVGGHYLQENRTSLNLLLSDQQKRRDMKVAICLILLEHAKEDHVTAEFLQASFWFAIMQTGNESDNEDDDDEEAPAAAVEPAVDETCQILLEAGIDPRMSMYIAIQAENVSLCQLLVREYHVDPFLQQEEEDDDSDDETAASPFLAAARLPDTSLFEYFLDHWNERFSSTNGGKNSDGDYPIHVVCCDPRVSLQAIKMLVNRQADALAAADGEQGLLPFHFAANWDASLDVIFYLLQHCPDALSHVGNASSSATTVRHCLPNVGRSGSTNGMIESNSDDNKQQEQSDLNAPGPAPKKAKTTHSI